MAAVQVFTDINFGGVASPVLDQPVSNASNFNDQISSIKVFNGEWIFCSDADFTGVCLILGPGEYPDVRNLDSRFNDIISSFKPTVQ